MGASHSRSSICAPQPSSIEPLLSSLSRGWPAVEADSCPIRNLCVLPDLCTAIRSRYHGQTGRPCTDWPYKHNVRNIMQPREKYNTLWRHSPRSCRMSRWKKRGTNCRSVDWRFRKASKVGITQASGGGGAASVEVWWVALGRTHHFTFIHNFAELSLGQGEVFSWDFLGKFAGKSDLLWFHLKKIKYRYCLAGEVDK